MNGIASLPDKLGVLLEQRLVQLVPVHSELEVERQVLLLEVA